MDNKRVSLDYRDTDERVEIEIYGLVFEIKELNKEELEKIDRSNNNELEREIDKALGKGAVEKINKKRVQDGYKEMDVTVASNILGFIMETYVKGTVGNVVNKTVNAVNDTTNNMVNLMNRNNFNKEQRRNYNRNYRRNNRYNGRYY